MPDSSMRVDIVGHGDNATVVRLRDKLRRRDHSVRVVPGDELYVDLAAGGCVVAPYDILALPDVLVSASTTDCLTALDAIRVLAASGVPVVNPPDALERSANKFRTALALQSAGVRHPRVLQVCTARSATAAGRRLGYPVVLKAPDGSEGNAVFLVGQESEMSGAVTRLRRWCGQDPAGWTPLLVQELVAGSLGRDKRVFVVGGHPVASMERVAQRGEWRSNLSRGAHPRPASLTAAEADAAVRGVLAVGLDFGVVDVMPLSAGPVVLEVNSFGDLVDIIAMSGVDAIDVLCSFIESKCGGRWCPPSDGMPRLERSEWRSEVRFAWARIHRLNASHQRPGGPAAIANGGGPGARSDGVARSPLGPTGPRP